MSYEKKKIARWLPVSFLLTALFFLHLKKNPLKNLDVLSAKNTTKPCSEKLQGFFFPHNTQHRMLSAKLETNIHCWSQFLPSDACIHKCKNETAQLSAQFVVINLHIYQERSDIRLPILSPRLVEADNSPLTSHWCWQWTRQKQRVVLFCSDRGTIQRSSPHERAKFRGDRGDGKPATDSADSLFPREPLLRWKQVFGHLIHLC